MIHITHKQIIQNTHNTPTTLIDRSHNTNTLNTLKHTRHFDHIELSDTHVQKSFSNLAAKM